MNQVLTVAVGLLIAAALMISGAQPFFTWWISSEYLSSLVLAMEALSPAMASSGVWLGISAFVAGCLGAGLLLSGMLADLLGGSGAVAYKSQMVSASAKMR